MSTQEAVVQVAPDSTGKLVRNLSIDLPQPVDENGNAVAPDTVHMQTVALVDTEGDLLDGNAAVLDEIKALMERQNELLELVLGALS